MQITNHSKQRIVERTPNVDCFREAKKVAKVAFYSGKTINDFQKYPKFFNYLQTKKNQANDCAIRVYRNNIFIWRGSKKSLVTAYPIPERFYEELKG